MAITHYYVRPTNGADVAGQGTTHATAYKTTQFALNDIGTTHGRNTIDGDQINICASVLEGPDVLAAPLTLATYGTPAYNAPLILRGYTAVANDGGVGEIDCGGAPEWVSTAYDYIHQLDLELHTFGDNNGVQLDDYCSLIRCQVHKGASNPNGKFLVLLDNGANIHGCYVHDAGVGTSVCIGTNGGNGHVTGNYVNAMYYGIYTVYGCTVHGNIVYTQNNGIVIMRVPTICENNVVYAPTGATGCGILADSLNAHHSVIRNNILCNFSGVGGRGIDFNNYVILQAGFNAFYNCATNNQNLSKVWDDLTAHDVTLAANPFTDAANGDFSLTEAARAALRSAGWPSAYLGASTDPHITIGAVQYGEGGGGGAVRRAMRILGG